MNVIWHNDEGMQKIVPEDIGVVVHGFHDHVRDGWLAEARPRHCRLRPTTDPKRQMPVPS